MYIGRAAKDSGATIKAIRLYEQLGLLSNIERDNSYRIFTEEDILLIKFIKIAQTFDFKLSELKKIIHPKEGGAQSWENIEKAINLKEESISEEISRLKGNRIQLNNYRKEIIKCLADHQNCLFPHTKK